MCVQQMRTCVTSHLFQFIIQFTDIDDTVTLTKLLSTTPLPSDGLTGDEPNLTSSKVAWTESQNLCEAQAAYGPISSILTWRSTRNFTGKAASHNNRNVLAEQHIKWQQHGRHAFNFKQVGFARAAREY